MADTCSDFEAQLNESETPKKRPKLGRKREIEKQEKLKDHKTGEPCGCSRLKCFESVNNEQRKSILDRFTSLKSKDEQDAMIMSCVSLEQVSRRRPRKDEAEANFNQNSYKYKVITITDKAEEVQICHKAMLSIFGIKKGRLETIQRKMKTGAAPTDQRGHHDNRPQALTDNQKEKIMNHIRSFKGRTSHYSLKESRRIYISEHLDVKKMWRMFLEKHPEEKISRETYRLIFVTKFNRAFGYPRKDTCSTCDAFKVELGKPVSPERLTALKMEQELHWRKGQTFYQRKTQAAEDARSIPHLAAACFDYWKNLPCPNITTNDVYYKRQLSTFTFNIHCLGSEDVHLYCYDESVGKKGSNDVASMLLHYFNSLPEEITHLRLFCDSCGGQNKNYTVLRFLHFMVNEKKRFHHIKITFPVRGHSYMECDRDMVMIKQNSPCETPADWQRHFVEARINPQPFNVINVTKDMLFHVDQHIQHLYYATNPIKIQKMREIIISNEHPRLIKFRDCWNGPFQTAAIAKPQARKLLPLPPLKPSYEQPLAIQAKKYVDLQFLKKFCLSEDSRKFFSGLVSSARRTDENIDSENLSDIDDEEEDEC